MINYCLILISLIILYINSYILETYIFNNIENWATTPIVVTLITIQVIPIIKLIKRF